MQRGLTQEDASPRRRLGRRTLRLVLVALLALPGLKAGWFFHCRTDAGQAIRGQDRAELMARRAYLVSRVTAPDFGPQEFPSVLGAQFQGEWALVSLSMTALALAGLSQQFPDTAPAAEADLDRISERALTAELAAFDTRRWNEPALETLASDRGHVGYLGHLTLILAAREVSFPGGRHQRLLRELAAALARKIDHGPCGLAQTYPEELYLPDNAVALAALALAARAGSGPDVAAGLLQTLHARYAAPTSGLLPFRLSASCQAIDLDRLDRLDRPDRPDRPDRSSGAAWSLLYLGLVDEGYLRRGYQAMREQFLARPLPGLWGLREWPQGVERSGDVDSGPLPLGLSPAGTGFAIASARRLGDAWTLQRLLDTAELAGFSIEIGGRRRYMLAPLVGDAILLAARAPLRAL